jgi:quercetin dioxygenase-like cupin family protein
LHETGPGRQSRRSIEPGLNRLTQEQASEAIAQLLRYARQRLLHAGGAVPDAAGWRAVLPTGASAIPCRRPADRVALPVGRWWARAQRLALPPVRQALAALAPSLAWTQNPNYRARPPHARFLHRYGYAVLLGRDDSLAPPLVRHDGLAVGLLLLGPDNEYPRHEHPAEEIYLPLSGAALWQRGAAPWQKISPGTPIHHPSDLPHATRTGAAPLLALYLWRGAIETAARLSGV